MSENSFGTELYGCAEKLCLWEDGTSRRLPQLPIQGGPKK